MLCYVRQILINSFLIRMGAMRSVCTLPQYSNSLWRFLVAGAIALLFPAYAMAANSAPGIDTAPKKEQSGHDNLSLPRDGDIVPHQAIYMIKLGGTKNGSRISDLTGRMFVSWADDCHD